MKVKKVSLLFIIILGWMVNVRGQDVIYSQFYANPVYLNPALAGSKACPRLTLNYRNQWPTINNGYTSFSASYDQPVEKISGALCVMVNADVAAGGIYNSFSGSGIYSYQLSVSRYIILNAAIQAGYVQRRLDWNKLIFEDQANQVVPAQLNVGKADFSAGLLAGYKQSLYLGVAVNHLTRPDMSYYEGTSNRMDMRFTIHTGVFIDLKDGLEGRDSKNLSIAPNVVYEQQGEFRQLNAGLYVNKLPFVFGVWMRHNFENADACIILLGFQHNQYKIGYSFDYTLSRVSIQSGGAHEISVAYLFDKSLISKKYKQIKSPDF